MQHLVTPRLAVPALVLLGALPWLADGALRDLILVLVTGAAFALGAWTTRTVPRAKAVVGAATAGLFCCVVVVTDRMVHGGAAGKVGLAATLLGSACFMVHLFAIVRERRPEEHLDGVFDCFAALAGIVAVQWQWSALQPGATPVSVAAVTSSVVALFCLMTCSAVFWRIAEDPRQNPRVAAVAVLGGLLLVVAVVGSSTFSTADGPAWALSAWLMGITLVSLNLASPDYRRITLPEPPRRRLIEMRWVGPASALLATPLMMLAFIVHGHAPGPATSGAAGALTLVALWRGSRLIRDREHARRQLAGEQRFRALVEHAADVILVLDPALRVSYASGGVGQMLGRNPEQLTGLDAHAVLGADVTALLPGGGSVAVRSGASGSVLSGASGSVPALAGDLRLLDPAGGERYVTVNVTDHRLTPSIGGWVLNVHDVTDRSKAEQALSVLALQDSLTGLANRAGLRRRLEELLDGDGAGATALLFCDLDGFKPVNDVLGHEGGDEVLGRVAGLWSACLRADDIIGRWGGDEFLIICPGLDAPAAAELIAARLSEVLRAPLPLSGTEVRIGVSVGVVEHREGESVDALVARADAAMYSVKRAREGVADDRPSRLTEPAGRSAWPNA